MVINKQTTKKLYIPRGSMESISFDTFKLILYSDSTTQQYNFYVEDTAKYYDYFLFEVDLGDIPIGIYEWHLHPYTIVKPDPPKKEKEFTFTCISRGIIKIYDETPMLPEMRIPDPKYYETDEEDKIIYYED